MDIAFCNWKKAIKYSTITRIHANIKLLYKCSFLARGKINISSQLDARINNSQEQWRSFLSLKFLGKCALPIRGHVKESGVLFKLMKLRSTEVLVCSIVFHLTVRDTCHQISRIKLYNYCFMMFNDELLWNYETVDTL